MGCGALILSNFEEGGETPAVTTAAISSTLPRHGMDGIRG